MLIIPRQGVNIISGVRKTNTLYNYDSKYTIWCPKHHIWGRRDRDYILVGFTTTNAYHH
jgi:hypothetical protein